MAEETLGSGDNVKAGAITIPINWLWPIIIGILTIGYASDLRMDNKVSVHSDIKYHVGVKAMVDEEVDAIRVHTKSIREDVTDMKALWNQYLVKNEGRMTKLETDVGNLIK